MSDTRQFIEVYAYVTYSFNARLLIESCEYNIKNNNIVADWSARMLEDIAKQQDLPERTLAILKEYRNNS